MAQSPLNPLMSREDAIAYGLLAHVELFVPTDSELWAFICEEVRVDEDYADTVKRLLVERLDLSKIGF